MLSLVRSHQLGAGNTNDQRDVFIHNVNTGRTKRVSVGLGGAQADDSSVFATLTANGRFVAFVSFATNLVVDDTNGTGDVFVYDRQTETTTRVSVGPRGTQANDFSDDTAMSAYGRFVAFYSFASNLVPDDTNGVADVFVHDRRTGTTRRVSVGPRLAG